MLNVKNYFCICNLFFLCGISVIYCYFKIIYKHCEQNLSKWFKLLGNSPATQVSDSVIDVLYRADDKNGDSGCQS